MSSAVSATMSASSSTPPPARRRDWCCGDGIRRQRRLPAADHPIEKLVEAAERIEMRPCNVELRALAAQPRELGDKGIGGIDGQKLADIQRLLADEPSRLSDAAHLS